MSEKGAIGKRESQYDEQMSALVCEISRTADLQSVLAERLASVLRDEVSTAKDNSAPLDEIVPLANDLRVQRCRIEGINANLDSMINALEL